MRHRVSGRKLNRTMEHRRALFRNMVTSLIVEERIETTLPKAKELRRVAERMVTLGKRGTLHARRQALSYVRSNDAVQKLFSELAQRFSERPGGYTRVLRLGDRLGDSAPMAIIEYLGAPMKPSREERRKARAAERKTQEEEARKAKKVKKPKKSAKAKGEKKTKEDKQAQQQAASQKPTKDIAKKEANLAKPPKDDRKSKGGKRGVLSRVLGRRGSKGDR